MRKSEVESVDLKSYPSIPNYNQHNQTFSEVEFNEDCHETPIQPSSIIEAQNEQLNDLFNGECG